jgi:hypothetical protein
MMPGLHCGTRMTAASTSIVERLLLVGLLIALLSRLQTESNPKDFIAGMVLNPSLEMVSLRRNDGKWELAPVHLFREMGFTSPREGVYLGRSVPHSGVVITPTSWRVHLAGGLEVYEVNPESEMNKLALRHNGILAIITQAADPSELSLDVMNKIMASGHTVAGWVPVHHE